MKTIRHWYSAPAPQTGIVLVILALFPSSHSCLHAADALFQSHDVVAFLGGEDTVAMNEHGYMELLLSHAASRAGANPRFRNLGWEGDTVFEQRRDLNFGTWSEQLQRAEATVLICRFGKMEALRGTEHLGAFIEAYEKLLDEWSRRTDRIVLLSPTPFERAPDQAPDLASRNGDVAAYAQAIQALAEKRGLKCVDLYQPLLAGVDEGPNLTRDGQHLNAAGHWAVARETARQLGLEPAEGKIQFDAPNQAVRTDRLERARQLIRQKNRLWFDYWRPMNWAFLAGDRTEQPSSRDHRDPSVRWFPQEMLEFLPLIEQKESEIQKLIEQP
jgi:hypothetical protein